MPIGSGKVAVAEVAYRPLHMWNNSVQETTLLNRKRDVLPAFNQLVESLNDNWYGSKLSKDSSLFIKDKKQWNLE